MTRERIDFLATHPAAASRDEIRELAERAKLEESRRHVLWAVMLKARSLISRNTRGGVAFEIHEMARGGLKDLPDVT